MSTVARVEEALEAVLKRYIPVDHNLRDEIVQALSDPNSAPWTLISESGSSQAWEHADEMIERAQRHSFLARKVTLAAVKWTVNGDDAELIGVIRRWETEFEETGDTDV